MAWTSPDDVVRRWIGDAPPEDLDQLEDIIGSAERKIRREVPGIVARLAANPVVEPDLVETVKDVVIDMIHRLFRNPEGIRQMQESTGPMSGTITFAGDHPGSLYLTEENRRDLAPPNRNSKAFEINLVPERPAGHPLSRAWVNGPDDMAPGGGDVD